MLFRRTLAEFAPPQVLGLFGPAEERFKARGQIHSDFKVGLTTRQKVTKEDNGLSDLPALALPSGFVPWLLGCSIPILRILGISIVVAWCCVFLFPPT